MQYTEEELQKILDEHKKWISDESGKRADLSGADLIGTDLSNADLAGANLEGANLRRARLSHADLKFANLTDANLYYANLFDADLKFADLTGADLTGADLFNATFSNTLIFSKPVNKAPLKLYDLPYSVLITDTMMAIGCQVHSIDEWLAFTVEEINAMESDAKKFYKNYGKLIQDLAISHRVLKEENRER